MKHWIGKIRKWRSTM